MTDKISFAAFIATRHFHPNAREHYNPDIFDYYTYDKDVTWAQPVLVYMGRLTIEIQTPQWPAEHRNNQYHLTIENWSRESDDLEELEKVLYEWYLTS